MLNIRKAKINDSRLLTEFVIQLDNESDYLRFDPNERQVNVETTKKYLSKIDSNENSVVFIAENAKGEIVGFICGEAYHLKRVSHVMKANIGVLRNYRCSGIGRALGKAFFEFLKNTDIKRIEATVIANNIPSLRLCKSFGFITEGKKKNSIKVGERFFDEYILAKIM